MLQDLSTSQRVLADYMSGLSETAYCAGWKQDLEFALWRFVVEGVGRYGQMDVTVEHIKNLHDLSHDCGGWIVFDDESEETFVALEEWQRRYAANIKSGEAFQ